MTKVTKAVCAATALTAVTIGLAAPAMAAAPTPGSAPMPAASMGFGHGGYPLDCSVHVRYYGTDVDVNWC